MLWILIYMPRQKRSTSNRRHRQQHYKEQEEEDDLKIDEEEEVKSQKTGRVDTKRRLRHTKNKSQTSMKSTAEESTLVSTSDKLPKIAKSARKTEVTGRKMIRDENKHEDLEVAKERVDQEDEEKPKKSPENAKKHAPSSRSRNHSSERKIPGASSTSAAERKNVDKKSSRSESTMSKGHSTSSLSELLNTGDDNEADKPKSPSISDHVEDDDEEFEVVSEKIKKILTNPTYVFSYTNITGDDFVSLQEMVFQSDVGSMQLLEKNEADKLEAERKRAALETRDNNLRVPIKILKNEDALKGKRSDEEETQAPDMKSA